MRRALCLLFALLCPVASAWGQPPVSLLRSSDTGVVLSLKSGSYALAGAGNGYHRVLLSGFEYAADLGDPNLPRTATLIGLPYGTIPELEVLHVVEESLPAVRMVPMARPDTVPVESTAYDVNETLPEQPVRIGFVGAMRGVPVAQVQFYPVRYNPVTGNSHIIRSMEVAVHFVADPKRRKVAQANGLKIPSVELEGPYQNILSGSLINYDTLVR